MKLVGRRAKYAWKEYKTNKDILLGVKNNPVVKKIRNYVSMSRLKQNVQRMDTDRLTYIIMKYQRSGKRIH